MIKSTSRSTSGEKRRAVAVKHESCALQNIRLKLNFKDFYGIKIRFWQQRALFSLTWEQGRHRSASSCKHASFIYKTLTRACVQDRQFHYSQSGLKVGERSIRGGWRHRDTETQIKGTHRVALWFLPSHEKGFRERTNIPWPWPTGQPVAGTSGSKDQSRLLESEQVLVKGNSQLKGIKTLVQPSAGIDVSMLRQHWFLHSQMYVQYLKRLAVDKKRSVMLEKGEDWI